MKKIYFYVKRWSLILALICFFATISYSQDCPDLPGGVTNFTLSSTHQFAYPGNLPTSPVPTATSKATAGTIIPGAGTHPEGTPALITLIPTLDGESMGLVAIQFLTLNLGTNDVIRIYEGEGANAILEKTITSATQGDEIGVGIVVKGITTISYTGNPSISTLHYFTGDQSFEVVTKKPIAIWNDFIEANSHVVVDDTRYGDDNTWLPVVTAFFGEDKKFAASTLKSFCIDAYADIPTLYPGYPENPNVQTYPGQISYTMQNNENYDLNGGGHDDSDKLIAARMLWLIEESNKTGITNDDLVNIQYAVWNLQDNITSNNGNNWLTRAVAAVPGLPTPPEPSPFSIALSLGQQSTVYINNSILLDIAFNVPEDSDRQLTLILPTGVVVKNAIGGTWNESTSILTDIIGNTVSLELSADAASAGSVQIVYDDESYYNVANLNIYVPCTNSYQRFLHVGERNLVRPFRSIELKWIPDPLPVSLISFTANSESSNVNLQWRTTNETDFSHFEVEKSQDSKKWESIVRINGNNSGLYSATDALLGQGISYYRLKMIDRDGSFAYSRIEHIKAGNIQVYFAYPNPATDRLFIKQHNNQKIEIYDLIGRLIIQSATSENGVDISELRTGVYLAVTSLNDGTSLSQRFVKK
jgi:hypothetical protein